jgi:hypothetical protein
MYNLGYSDPSSIFRDGLFYDGRTNTSGAAARRNIEGSGGVYAQQPAATEAERRHIVKTAQRSSDPEGTLQNYTDWLTGRERSSALDADGRRQTDHYRNINNIDARSYAQRQRIDTAAERSRLGGERMNDFLRGDTGNQRHQQQMQSTRQELGSLERRAGMTAGAEVQSAQINADATTSSTQMQTDMQRYLGELEAQNHAARLAARETADRRQAQSQLMGYALQGSNPGNWRYW